MSMDLGIAQIGLAVADKQRLNAILGIAVANGTLRGRWCVAEPAAANVIVVSGDGTEEINAAIKEFQQPGKTIVMLAGESDTVPNGCEKLPWPIRLEHVVDLLCRTENSILRAADKQPRAPVALDADNHLVRLATLLRDAQSQGASAAWQIKGFKKSDLYIVPRDGIFYFNDSLETLREVPPDISLEFLPLAVEAMPKMGSKKPIVMLQWLVGLIAGPNGLFPWMNDADVFRLKRFPDFQLLVHGQHHRRIAAALARPRRSVSLIAKISDTKLDSVNGFLNAMSVSGQLIISKPSGKLGKSGSKSPGTGARAGLFKSFRKALGIAT